MFSCLLHTFFSGSGDMKVMQFKVETGQKVLDLKVIVSVYSSNSMSLEKVSDKNIYDHWCACRVTTGTLQRCLFTRVRKESLSQAVLTRPPGFGT